MKLVTSGDLGIPKPGVVLDPERTAIVITDPQNDFLSPEGVTWATPGMGRRRRRTTGSAATRCSLGSSR